ncbi:MAG: hypothetical protein MUP97_06250 [Acidimicrobiia bacterium]|nr:hypothetical protein [Acidimicrobiia bacterium]
MATRSVRIIVVLSLVAAIALGGAPAGAAPKAAACDLVTTGELGAALGSTFGPGEQYVAGTGVTCGFEATGPVRGATVRVARGKQAKVAMTKSLKALRETLRSVDSDPPKKVAGLGDKAYYSLDEFLDEGSVEVLDGKTFVQVTAILSPGADPGLVSEQVLTGLARQALDRA